jgi:hypothetical protein
MHPPYICVLCVFVVKKIAGNTANRKMHLADHCASKYGTIRPLDRKNVNYLNN